MEETSITDNLVTKIGQNISQLTFSPDLSDLGDCIGSAIADLINSEKSGFDTEDFISGINHGISNAQRGQK